MTLESLYGKFIGANQLYNFHYHCLLQDILYQEEMNNQRTNTRIKALPNRVIGYSLQDVLPLINTRKMFPVTAFAELCWTLSGSRKLDWLQKYTKMWNDFANENNEVEAAYGYRWRHMFGRDQLLDGIKALKKDPSDRQVYISAWDNGRDGLGNHWASNVPCPTSFCVNIINNKVNMTVFLRSSDAIVGLPYDMLMYSLLLVVITNEIRATNPKLRLGRIDAMLSHVHIYAAHYDIAEELIKNAQAIDEAQPEKYHIQDLNFDDAAILWQFMSVSEIIKRPDGAMELFKEILQQQKNISWPPKSNPLKHYKPEIIK